MNCSGSCGMVALVVVEVEMGGGSKRRELVVSLV